MVVGQRPIQRVPTHLEVVIPPTQFKLPRMAELRDAHPRISYAGTRLTTDEMSDNGRLSGTACVHTVLLSRQPVLSLCDA